MTTLLQCVEASAAPTMFQGQLRVLHVVPALHGGGLERAMLRLVCAKSEPDGNSGRVTHGVCVLQGGDQDLLSQCSASARTWDFGISGRWGKRIASLRLRRLVKDFAPDVVHVRSTGAWLDACLAVRGLPGTRLVLGFHGKTQTTPVGRMRRAVNRWCAARADAVVAVSDHAGRMLREEWDIPEPKLRVLRNAVDTNRFRPARDQTERDECRRLLGVGRSNNAVVCVANLLPIKNLDGLLRAWRQVAMMDPFARLALVGQGPLRNALERLAVELRCDGTVRFLGARSDVPLLLRGADVSVLASRYEGTSNAVLESMASGVAVVASDVGGTPELLTPNRTGWLVNGEDPHRFAEVLVAALQERAARQRVAAAARECAVKHFSLDAWIAGHKRLYREVAAKRPVTLNKRRASCAE